MVYGEKPLVFLTNGFYDIAAPHVVRQNFERVGFDLKVLHDTVAQFA